jgi:tRNA G18 (ribose-2'-O)-methylase SpoU
VPEALDRGNTLRRRPCVHWIYGDVCRWLGRQRERGSAIVGVELTDESIRLADFPAARQRTVVGLGNEGSGIPPDAMELLDVAAEIPMVGSGHSLNVAVAASLVLYKVSGLM